MVSKELLNFSWGDTRGLRDVILRLYDGFINTNMPLKDYGYPPLDGDPILVEQLRNLTYELTGVLYKNICVTAGCTHAVNAAINTLKIKSSVVVSRKLYYPRYPAMARLNDLSLASYEDHDYNHNDVAMIDSPSNPMGSIEAPELRTEEIIWDAAYHSPVYGMPYMINMVSGAKVFCGSLSKLTGINGLRLGWTATNHDYTHVGIQQYVKNSVCGISYPSQHIASQILKQKDLLHTYFQLGNHLINNNREEVTRLKGLFGSDKISPFGMFAFFQVDDSMLELFKQAKVEFTDGKDCGADYESVRINLANSNESTKEMVNRILAIDKA